VLEQRGSTIQRGADRELIRHSYRSAALVPRKASVDSRRKLPFLACVAIDNVSPRSSQSLSRSRRASISHSPPATSSLSVAGRVCMPVCVSLYFTKFIQQNGTPAFTTFLREGRYEKMRLSLLPAPRGNSLSPARPRHRRILQLVEATVRGLAISPHPRSENNLPLSLSLSLSLSLAAGPKSSGVPSECERTAGAH